MLDIQSCYVRDMDSSWSMKDASNHYGLLLYTASGQLSYRVDGISFSLQQGDALFVPPGAVRSGSAITEHRRYVAFFNIHVDESTSLPILLNNQACKITIVNPAYFKQRFSMLNHHWMSKGKYRSLIGNAILLEMMGVINEDMDQRGRGSKQKKLVTKIQNYIFNHYAEPVKLKDLADVCDKSPNYVSHVFKEVTGCTIVEYINDVRISVAKDMMLTNEMSIREISELVGFCDQAYFNRVFRRISGCSPTDFLKQ